MSEFDNMNPHAVAETFFWRDGIMGENNPWGMQNNPTASGQACLYTSKSGDPFLAGIEWDYQNQGGGVLAYHQLWIGKKPWWKGGTSDDRFPMLLEKAAFDTPIVVDYGYTVEATGSWNAAFDLWICNNPRCAVEDIVAEVMVWTAKDGTQAFPAGDTKERNPDVEWTFFQGQGQWPIYTFLCKDATNSPRNDGPLSIGLFLKDLISRGLLVMNSQQLWVASVEMGFEIWDGKGRARITKLAVKE